METSTNPHTHEASTLDASRKEAELLRVEKLSFGYTPRKPIIEDVSFAMQEGDILAVLGCNGVGKSTMLDCIAGLMAPTSGTVYLQQRPLPSIPLREVAKVMAYVPQIAVPALAYNVRDYVAMGRAPHMGMLDVPGEKELTVVDAMLDRFEITPLADKLCTQLSGGEFQQVQIARALVQEPRLIMLDEPTNHLDFGNQMRVLRILAELAAEGIAVLFTTHNPDHAIQIGGKAGVFAASGHFVVGPSAEVITEESVRSMYRIPIHMPYVEDARRVAVVTESFMED